jgi:hypothetical protein
MNQIPTVQLLKRFKNFGLNLNLLGFEFKPLLQIFQSISPNILKTFPILLSIRPRKSLLLYSILLLKLAHYSFITRPSTPLFCLPQTLDTKLPPLDALLAFPAPKHRRLLSSTKWSPHHLPFAFQIPYYVSLPDNEGFIAATTTVDSAPWTPLSRPLHLTIRPL